MEPSNHRKVERLRAYADAVSYRIRAVRPDDADTLPRLRSWAASRTAANTTPPLVAEDEDGASVGFVVTGAARDERDRTAEVYTLEVASDHWGCGAGCDLLATAVDRLSRSGFDRAVLWIDAANVRARRFYELHGWSDDSLERDVTPAERGERQARYSRSLV
jgi:L-amino acid N-acyltransferase YncA